MKTCNLNTKLIANADLDKADLFKAWRILAKLQKEIDSCDINSTCTAHGFGPFRAAIYDANDNLISVASNSVVNDMCSNNHAEMNAIRDAQKLLNTYDLTEHNLTMYVTSEPCMMCLGAIMWSGIRRVFYGVPSNRVEEITGFDEGFKQGWLNEFARRGIRVYGNIASKIGEQELENYVANGNLVYKPDRN
ncbi:MAG: nucleoside deaminase [Alphaproteobacteria bacterium]|nr:nucleoside deaminase [Alphaproteobacteria bacterium]